MNALELFRKGHDAQQIAGMTGMDEAVIYNEIYRLKKLEARLSPAEYQSRYQRKNREQLRTLREASRL